MSGQNDHLITFPSAFQEGVYNAFIQLAEDSGWAPPVGKQANPKNGLKMKRLEWNWPAGADATANASAPGSSEHPLWLATIGTAGHYPINILNTTPANEAELKLHSLKLHSLELGPTQFFPLAFWGSLALLGVVHALGLKFGGVVHSYFKRDFDMSDTTNTVTMVRAFCHLMALLTITLAQLILGSGYLFFYRSGWRFTWLACLVGSATAFLLGMAWRQVRLLSTLHTQQSQLAVPDERSRIISPKRILRTSITGMAIMVGAGLFWIGVTIPTTFGNAFLHFRDPNLSGGVAPRLPIRSGLMGVDFGVWAYLRG